MTTIQHPVQRRLSAVVAILSALVATAPHAGEATAADEACQAPESETVISEVLDWRTLVTREGDRLVPAGIGDFGTIAVSSSAFPDAAENALSKKMSALAGRTVGISRLATGVDRRGRVPVLLWADGQLLQRDLLGRGLAVAFPFDGDLPCSGILMAAEDEARTAQRGFWHKHDHWIAGTRPEDFSGRINGYVIMQGRVVSVGTRPERTYLNFGGRWASDVTVEIPDRNRAAFGGPEALESLAGTRIRVRGFAVEKAGPMIELQRPWQIERLTNHPG